MNDSQKPKSSIIDDEILNRNIHRRKDVFLKDEYISTSVVMEKKTYQCKYCGKKMNKIEYDMYHGYCVKCREIIDWKQILSEYKNTTE